MVSTYQQEEEDVKSRACNNSSRAHYYARWGGACNFHIIRQNGIERKCMRGSCDRQPTYAVYFIPGGFTRIRERETGDEFSSEFLRLLTLFLVVSWITKQENSASAKYFDISNTKNYISPKILLNYKQFPQLFPRFQGTNLAHLILNFL